MLITPRMSWRRRVGGIAAGFGVIFVVHLVFVYVTNDATAAAAGDATLTAHGFMRIVPANALSDSIPFVLWVIIAREWLWERVAHAFPTPPAPDTPAD